MTHRLLYLLMAVMWLVLSAAVFARGPVDRQLAKNGSQDKFFATLSNIQNMNYWVAADGEIGHNPNTGDTGGFYPRGTGGVVYAEGLVWGGYVQDANPDLRVGGATYVVGTDVGWIQTPGTYFGDDSTNAVAVAQSDSRARIYRIRSDYASLSVSDAGLRRDAAEHLSLDVEDVTDSDVQFFIDQYEQDWSEWPIDLGAPFYDVNLNGVYDAGQWIDLNGDGKRDKGEVEEPGVANADQVIYFVANDMNSGRTTSLYGSRPIGMELQVTIWGYNQPGGTLGQMMFKRFRFINKSGYAVDSMFVSQWVDPDVGQYTDDLAGVDVDRSLGFGYSGFLTDIAYDEFGLPPAAVGFDFFQGPMVDGEPGDTANFDFKKVPGKKNLPASSFIFFAAGSPISDPPLGNPDGTLEWYNMLNGFTPTVDLENPTPYIVGAGPQAGQETKFPLSGDPFRQTGDIDAFGANFPPGDRRIAINSGPFSLANGDTQEVVVGVVGGIVDADGGTNRNAVEQMKLNDDFAQALYDGFFQGIPTPPGSPEVDVTVLDDAVVLNWGGNPDAVAASEVNDPLLGFNFEGYNVYQLPSQTATSKSQATKIVTYDLNNFVTTIRGKQFVAEFGDILEVPIQQGFDSGIKRYFTVEKDYINDRPLRQGTTYYFAVTAYNFTSDIRFSEPSLESGIQPIAVIPQDPKPGTRLTSAPGDELEVTKASGTSDGVVQVTVIDPGAVTGDDYEIFFAEYQEGGETKFGWNVRNSSTGEVLVANQSEAATLDESDTQPIFDGLQVKVTGPSLNFKSFQVVQNGGGAVDPPDMGAFAFNGNGFPLLDGSDRPDGARQQTNGSTWGVHTGMTTANDGTYDYFVERVTQGGARWSSIIPYDWEIRFNGDADNFGYEPNAFVTGGTQGGTLMSVPFEIWRIGSNTPDDPSDDVRLFPYLIDWDGDGSFNLVADPDVADHSVSGADNDPYTDWIYWVLPEDESAGESGYQALLSQIQTEGDLYEYLSGSQGDVMRRMVLVNWNGGSISDPSFPANVDALMPEAGTVFRIFSTKPNSVNDVFTFKAPEVQSSQALAEAEVERINVFPNPYYAGHENEGSRLTRYVTFNHLPARADIRIFNLAGEQVVMLEHNSDSQFERWDLRNDAGLPVASGIYIAYVDMPDLNKTKTLKLFVVQRAEVLQFF